MTAMMFGGGLRSRATSVQPLAPTELVSDGAWTWFNDPRAIYSDGATYIGYITADGSPGVSKLDHATGQVSSFVLASGMEADDHDNPALFVRQDGKLLAAYSKHSADNLSRVRVASVAGSVAAWEAEQTIDNGAEVCYANLHKLSDSAKLYFEFRSGFGAERPRKRWASANDGTSWDAAATWIGQTGQRPYTKSCSNGVDRIDFLITTGHPNEANSSVYHAYMRLDAGVEKFYKSDGTLIGTSMTPADGSMVYDYSVASQDGWVFDIAYGSNGHPAALFTKYVSTTDHRYMFARWTGSAWTTPAQICAAGSYLYAAEENYSGGMCFDGNNTMRVFVSVKTGGAWEVQEYRSADDGATWAKHRDITTDGGTQKNCRPWSPRGHDARLAVLWWKGRYTTYTDYSTAIWGAGDGQDPVNARVVINGQSNALGVGPRSELSTSPLSADAGLAAYDTGVFDRVYIWVSGAGAYQKLDMGTNQQAYTSASLGPEFGLAVRWMRERTGLLFIDKTTGDGSAIAQWRDGQTLFDTAQAQYTAASAWLTSHSHAIGVNGWLWVQGESDRLQTQAYYYGQLAALHGERLAASISPANEVVIVAQMVSGTTHYSADIVAAKSQFVAETDGANEVTFSSYLNGDNLHLNARGQLQLGYDAFEVLLSTDHIAA